MSFKNRIGSASFSAVPSFLFFIAYISIWSVTSNSYGAIYLAATSAFVLSSFIFGLWFPPFLESIGLSKPWAWILIQGLLGWIICLLVLGLLNLSSLCIGQDNGDGVNDFSLCMTYTFLAGIFYTPLQMVLLVFSAITGHWFITRDVLRGRIS